MAGEPRDAAARVLEIVRARGLLTPNKAIVAMLSGGRDSVCLLDLAVRLRGAASVSALHVNYHLREQSDGDERHCRSLCEHLGVELDVVHERRPSPADATAVGASTNLQAWAREARYRAADEIARRRGALVATGHTATDQVETILYRLAASPGRRALLGMVADDGQLLRPLLDLTREDTANYCRARGLDWREDETNESLDYARARVRHGLLPALRAVHPAAEANVLRTALLLREETHLLDRLVAEELAGAVNIAVARLGELPAALARLIVIHLAERAVGTYVPQAGDRVGEILALGRRGGRAELHLGARAGAVIDGGVLTMVKLPPRS